MKHAMVQAGEAAFPLYDDKYRAGTLKDRTLAIVGLGSIGLELARRARAFDMTVLGIRKNPSHTTPLVDEMHGMDRLHDVLSRADYVVLATPLTSETNQFFGAAAFAAMKPGAYLVNIARGNLIQEMALHDALTSERIAGFGCDVWFNYERSIPATYHFPVPSRTGVHKLPSVLGSGDQACNADGVLEAHFERAVQSVTEFAEQAPLTHEIDLRAGY